MPSYRVSKKAQNDIRDIGHHTEKALGREQRRQYLADLDETFELLAKHPRLAVERNEFDPPVRIHHHGRHLIVYLLDETGVLIVRVLHDAMDVPARLAG
jgi:toxin ParE1/3/4